MCVIDRDMHVCCVYRATKGHNSANAIEGEQILANGNANEFSLLSSQRVLPDSQPRWAPSPAARRGRA